MGFWMVGEKVWSKCPNKKGKKRKEGKETVKEIGKGMEYYTNMEKNMI